MYMGIWCILSAPVQSQVRIVSAHGELSPLNGLEITSPPLPGNKSRHYLEEKYEKGTEKMGQMRKKKEER